MNHSGNIPRLGPGGGSKEGKGRLHVKMGGVRAGEEGGRGDWRRALSEAQVVKVENLES